MAAALGCSVGTVKHTPTADSGAPHEPNLRETDDFGSSTTPKARLSAGRPAEARRRPPGCASGAGRRRRSSWSWSPLGPVHWLRCRTARRKTWSTIASGSGRTAPPHGTPPVRDDVCRRPRRSRIRRRRIVPTTWPPLDVPDPPPTDVPRRCRRPRRSRIRRRRISRRRGRESTTAPLPTEPPCPPTTEPPTTEADDGGADDGDAVRRRRTTTRPAPSTTNTKWPRAVDDRALDHRPGTPTTHPALTPERGGRPGVERRGRLGPEPGQLLAVLDRQLGGLDASSSVSASKTLRRSAVNDGAGDQGRWIRPGSMRHPFLVTGVTGEG